MNASVSPESSPESSPGSSLMRQGGLRFGPDAIRTPANVVTIARLLFTVPVLMLIADGRVGATSWAIFVAWSMLWVTDFIDGWLARRDGTTRSGAFLDPLVDKVLVLGGLIVLAVRGDFAWLPVLLIGAREVGISTFRSVAARRGVSMPARRLGKWKANVQFLAVAAALFPPTSRHPGIAEVVLWAAVAMTLVSGVDLVVHTPRPPRPSPPVVSS
ncbi:MAG: CDP-alcohol phosphatidyltransferase family protein [Actinomycetes bacterium]